MSRNLFSRANMQKIKIYNLSLSCCKAETTLNIPISNCFGKRPFSLLKGLKYRYPSYYKNFLKIRMDLNRSGQCDAFRNFHHVLVTGGAGYVGSVLVPLLLKEGLKVTVYDIFRFGVTPLLAHVHDCNLHLVKGDIRDQQLLTKVLIDVDMVIHLAAIVGSPMCNQDPELARSVNEGGTGSVVACLNSRQKLVYSCSAFYGAVKGIHYEHTPISPLTLYGKTKAAAEKIVISYGGVSLRLVSLFGFSSRMRLDELVNDLTMKALTYGKFSLYQGSFRRSFLHVRDAARAFLFALNNYDSMKGRAFNVGEESMNITKEQMAKRIQYFVPECKISVGHGEDKEQRDFEVSFAAIRNLGFRSTITLDDGIKELIDILPLMSASEITSSRNI